MQAVTTQAVATGQAPQLPAQDRVRLGVRQTFAQPIQIRTKQTQVGASETPVPKATWQTLMMRISQHRHLAAVANPRLGYQLRKSETALRWATAPGRAPVLPRTTMA
jgi:hypothetical protein